MDLEDAKDKIACTHCGEMIKASKINKFFKKHHAKDIPYTCMACGRFIRKADLTTSKPEIVEEIWPEEICWFCETRPAVDDFKAHTFLKKDETSTYTGTGTRYKGKVKTILVPRCERCKKIQRADKYILWFTIPLSLILLVFVPFFTILAGTFKISGGVFFLLLILFVGSIFVAAMSSNFILKKMYPDHEGTKRIYHKRNYPPVKSLEADGWDVQIDEQLG